eukprot:gene28837-32026_t
MTSHMIDSNADPLQRRVPLQRRYSLCKGKGNADPSQRSRRSSFSSAPTDPIACLKGAPYAREMQSAMDAVRIAARLCKSLDTLNNPLNTLPPDANKPHLNAT